jgi:hypothetical protein
MATRTARSAAASLGAGTGAISAVSAIARRRGSAAITVGGVVGAVTGGKRDKSFSVLVWSESRRSSSGPAPNQTTFLWTHTDPSRRIGDVTAERSLVGSSRFAADLGLPPFEAVRQIIEAFGSRENGSPQKNMKLYKAVRMI